jgi:hypothetical protein
MRVIAFIDPREVIESILRHLGPWYGGLVFAPAGGPPEAEGPWTREPCDDLWTPGRIRETSSLTEGEPRA